jgi:hypothetical protein
MHLLSRKAPISADWLSDVLVGNLLFGAPTLHIGILMSKYRSSDSPAGEPLHRMGWSNTCCEK